MNLIKHLTFSQRSKIFDAKKNRVSLIEISRNTQISYSICSYIWRMRNKREESQKNVFHDRSRVTTKQNDELYRRPSENSWLTLREFIAQSFLKRFSIKWRLHEFDDDYRKHRVFYKLALLSYHENKRFRFVNLNLQKEKKHWKHVW